MNSITKSTGRRSAAGFPRRGRTPGPMAVAAIGLSAALGAAAVYNAAKAKAAERRHPPAARFMTVDGVELHYVDRGNGFPVVLIHGNGALIEEQEASGIVDRLAATHRVIVFDRPGFGYSQRPRSRLWSPAEQARLIEKGLDRLGVQDAIVYGHSFGTLVAVQLAMLNPGRLRGLVLGSGFYYPAPRWDVALLSPPAIPGIGDLLRYTVSPFLSRALLPRIYEKLFAPAPVTPRFWREVPHDLLARPSQIRATAADTAFLVPAAANLQHRYRDLQVPVTIVVGEGDQIADPQDNSVRLHHELSGSRLLVLPGVGHMIHHTAPDVVVGAIDAMLRATLP